MPSWVSTAGRGGWQHIVLDVDRFGPLQLISPVHVADIAYGLEIWGNREGSGFLGKRRRLFGRLIIVLHLLIGSKVQQFGI
jgi:hypothetical protein